MANMLDYLTWRGDISFKEAPFNEVDNAILAQLSYLDWEGIIPTTKHGGCISIQEAAAQYRLLGRTDEIDNYEGVISPLTKYLPELLAQSKRFSRMKLGKLKATLDTHAHEQFFAFHCFLPERLVYVTFRGTDNTLLGWRENFTMTYDTAPAQQEALRYVNETCTSPLKRYMLGGHSKGANLAMYAGALCKPSVAKHIVKIWDNDGPGFDEDVLAHEKLASISHKLYTLLPAFDIVGQLLYAPVADKIILSDAKGMYQHSAISWLVEKDAFIAASAQEIEDEATPITQAFNDWFANASKEKKKAAFTDFFDMLERAHIKTLGELLSADPKVIAKIVNELPNTDKETRAYALDFFRRLAGNITANKIEGFTRQLAQQVQERMHEVQEDLHETRDVLQKAAKAARTFKGTKEK